ncbi:cellulose biosynthesis protein BcsR [Paraburkholderia sp. BL6665CI2N2]|uniref:cellulose biosynthesis protein BcsP n=1 Tax=Paraburkholderia sp. BL6665CI2N2 TaxID=1938806 RepID=UPI001066ABA2|nr:cellulose biosynthesis protein BcsP [Paraburkholderia sp. BL6665CI2N2]TDY22562.1 cellulose biosynthesis protein BcsR [Paraburkholderia sp. BL6665CI2N2]
MSSSSDIEKLFDHFGGDANAYQEIGRENEARSARTRWPLLVTLDLTQPTIPAIGQHREPKPQAQAVEAPVAVDRQDTTPKDAASVTRAKAPLFTRSHRRDIPPVAVAAPVNGPKGASRFGELETKSDATPPAAVGAVRVEAVAPVGAQAAPTAPHTPVQSTPAAAPFASAASAARTAPLAPVPHAAQPVSVPPAIPLRPPVMQAVAAAAPNWAQTPAPTRAYASTSAPLAPTAPAAPTQSASTLGKLFAPEPAFASAPPQPAKASDASAPLQSVFDRLRGTPAQAAAPAGATRAAAPATSNSWLINGPRRS